MYYFTALNIHHLYLRTKGAIRCGVSRYLSRANNGIIIRAELKIQEKILSLILMLLLSVDIITCYNNSVKALLRVRMK